MTDIPLDRLLALGEADLEKNYKDFVATAAESRAGQECA